MKHLHKLLVLFISAIILTGCFKKNVMDEDADDVEEVVIANAGGENILVSKESIFQATSKSSKQGIRTTTGYYEYRMSSYNLKTGELIKRIELGERDDNYHYFLGNTDGKLWYFSMNEDVGLHARDPKTLDIIVTQKQITDVNPFLKNNFPKVKWYELRKYFGYDYEKTLPMVSDNSGFVYSLDPVSLKAEKQTGSVGYFEYDKSIQSTSINISHNLNANLSGEPRKHISIENKDFDEVSFLKGEYLFSSGVVPLKEIYPEYFAPLFKEIEKKSRYIDSLNAVIEEQKNETDVWKVRNVQRMKDYIKRAQEDIKSTNEKFTRRNKKENLVISKDKGFFIIHNSSASDTAKILISKVLIDAENKSVSFIWTTLLPNIFAEPDKAFEKGGFEYVFSKGSPNFRTKRVIYADDKLVFISMLKAVCIDMNTGSILWEKFM